MAGLTIQVKYSCQFCGLERVCVSVPARIGEPIELWMQQTVHLICDDHDQRSPHCHPEEFAEVMIPYLGGRLVGERPIVH